jgi:hypothetical protein
MDAHTGGGFHCASILLQEFHMQAPQVARLEELQRVQYYMDQNTQALGAVNKSTARATLDEVVAALTGHHAAQHSAQETAQSRTENRNTLQVALRIEHMQPIAVIAGSKLASTPDISKMRLPRANVGTQRLLAAAESMAGAAEQYKQVFLDEQLPQDFIEQLRAAADAVRKVAVAREASRAALVQATSGVDEQIARGRAVVKVLNGLVLKQLAGQTELLRAWRFMKHVNAKPGVAQGTTVAPVAQPVPTPVVSPVVTPVVTPVATEVQKPAEGQAPGEVSAAKAA